MAKRKSLDGLCSEVIDELKKKIYRPIYILTGDEGYYIDMISDYIAENILDESEKAFNQHIIYGIDSDVSKVIEISRRFPMMSNHQVVIIKEAQHLKKIEDLEVYLRAPLKSTILVVCHKIQPTPSGAKSSEKIKKLFSQAAKIGLVFESKKLYDYQIPEWITEYLFGKGISIQPAPAELLKDYLGNDLSKIVNELDKLIITLPPETKIITIEHIERNIGISKDYNRFELTKLIGQRDIVRVNRIADYFARNSSGNHITMSISSIYQYFIKIFRYHFLSDKSERNVAIELGVNPFFVREYVSAARIYNPSKCVQIFALLRQYDMRAKGVNNESTDNGELLRELLFKIMH
jgi:DNA polymerase III subunit delta